MYFLKKSLLAIPLMLLFGLTPAYAHGAFCPNSGLPLDECPMFLARQASVELCPNSGLPLDECPMFLARQANECPVTGAPLGQCAAQGFDCAECQTCAQPMLHSVHMSTQAPGALGVVTGACCSIGNANTGALNKKENEDLVIKS